MEGDSKSVRKMELVVPRKNECFGIKRVHNVSNQADHKETQESNNYLCSEEYSVDKGHKSLMISGMLMQSGIGHFYSLIEHATP